MSAPPDKAPGCPVAGAAADNPRHTPPKVDLLKKREGIRSLVRRARNNILEVVPAVSLERPIVSGRLLRRFHVLSDPEGNRRVFKANIANYPKAPEANGILEKALKHGLFVLDGDEWRWQRRALNPAFAPRNVLKHGPMMTRVAAESAARLEGVKGRVNISDEMMRTAFDVIVRATFAGGDGESAVPLDVVSVAIDHYLSETGRVSLLDFLGLPNWVPRPGRVRTHPTLQALKDGADKAIADRRANPNTEDPALLDLLLDVADPETGRQMNDVELRDNLITFLIAGHETTALVLSWSLYLLANDPAVQDKASSEAARVLNGRVASVDDIAALPYIRQVLLEAMRLYPPIPMHLRKAKAPDRLCGHEVKEGDTVIVPFYAIHRHSAHWHHPHQFEPDRFADMSKINRYAYVPFSVGPRVCIGAEFAMQETILTLATLLSRFRFGAVEDAPPKPKLILTLRPDRDIFLNVSPLRPTVEAVADEIPARR